MNLTLHRSWPTGYLLVCCLAAWVVAISGCAGPSPGGPGARSNDPVTDSDEPEHRKRARIRMELAVGYFEQGQTNIALDELKQMGRGRGLQLLALDDGDALTALGVVSSGRALLTVQIPRSGRLDEVRLPLDEFIGKRGRRGKEAPKRRIERVNLGAHLGTFRAEAMPDIIGRRKTDSQHIGAAAPAKFHFIKGRERHIESQGVELGGRPPAALIPRLAQGKPANRH